MEFNVVTIDGPAASGKTSVSRNVAQRLGWNWVSTGAFYRGLGFIAKEAKADMSSEDALVNLVADANWQVKMTDDQTLFHYNDEDVTSEIFKEEVGNLASQLSGYPKVRAALLEAQRNLASADYGLVAEGRDCGSVVFPNAKVKVYLTANSKDRAKRRAEEQGRDLEKTIEAQKLRDEQDSTRKTAPMQIPEGAHVIDTSELTLDQVVDRVEELVRTTLEV